MGTVDVSSEMYGATLLALCNLSATAWVYLAVRPRPLGLSRILLSLPPIVALTSIVTLSLDPHYTLIITILTGIECLSAWKVAAYAVGRGPMVTVGHPGISEFLGLMWLPVIPSRVFRTSRGSTVDRKGKTAWQFLLAVLVKASLAITFGIVSQLPYLPPMLRDYFLALWLSQAIGAVWDSCSVVAVAIFGLEVAAATFDQPWLSSSFNEYW